MIRTRASRLGLVISVVGAALMIYHFYVARPQDEQRPESSEHRELVLKLEQESEARSRLALANALAGRSPPECAPSDDDVCFAQEQIDRMGLSTSAADLWAKWTPGSYIAAWETNLSDALRYSRSFQVAAVLVVIGLYLLLLYNVTLGRLLTWIKDGNQASGEA